MNRWNICNLTLLISPERRKPGRGRGEGRSIRTAATAARRCNWPIWWDTGVCGWLSREIKARVTGTAGGAWRRVMSRLNRGVATPPGRCMSIYRPWPTPVATSKNSAKENLGNFLGRGQLFTPGEPSPLAPLGIHTTPVYLADHRNSELDRVTRTTKKKERSWSSNPEINKYHRENSLSNFRPTIRMIENQRKNCK